MECKFINEIKKSVGKGQIEKVIDRLTDTINSFKKNNHESNILDIENKVILISAQFYQLRNEYDYSNNNIEYQKINNRLLNLINQIEKADEFPEFYNFLCIKDFNGFEEEKVIPEVIVENEKTIVKVINSHELTDFRFIFGRDNDILNVLRRINSGCNICLEAAKWMGKTTLLKALMSNVIRKRFTNIYNFEKWIFLYLDLRFGIESKKDFNQKIFEFIAAKFDKSNITSFEQISEILENESKILILLLDNFDSLIENDAFDEQFFNNLRYNSAAGYLKIVYTHRVGYDFSTNARKKKNYFNEAGYTIKFLPNHSIKDFIVYPFKYAGINISDDFITTIKYLAGNHPFFLSIARRILNEILHSNYHDFEEAINNLKEKYTIESTERYDELLSYFSSKVELEILNSLFKGEKKSTNALYYSIGYYEEDKFRAFSEHFLNYFNEYYFLKKS
ncbi:MAG: hypothetical protein U0W24_04290 [Bacteroidales bacterium]